MQCSYVFSQRFWPGIDPNPKDGNPDLDDCWVLSALQAVNACAPFLNLPSATRFRAGAGNPDDGVKDGGNPAMIAKGVRALWPSLGAMLHVVEGDAWADTLAAVRAGRPVSISLDSSKLAPELRFGFAGPHQATLGVNAAGTILFANPLAAPLSRWQALDAAQLATVKAAALAYGVLRVGRPGVWAVWFPSDDQAIVLSPAFREQVDAAVAKASAAAITAARADGFAAAIAKAGPLVSAAASSIAALKP